MAAVFRARETERADALFRDPYAESLAGKMGVDIANTLPGEQSRLGVGGPDLSFRLVHRAGDRARHRHGGESCRGPGRAAVPHVAARFVAVIEVDLPEILYLQRGILANEKRLCAGARSDELVRRQRAGALYLPSSIAVPGES